MPSPCPPAGGNFGPNAALNAAVYGAGVDVADVLAGKVPPPPEFQIVYDLLNLYMREVGGCWWRVVAGNLPLVCCPQMPQLPPQPPACTLHVLSQLPPQTLMLPACCLHPCAATLACCCRCRRPGQCTRASHPTLGSAR